MNLWIVVGDAGGARVFSSEGRGEPLQLQRTLEHERGRVKESDINSDRPGRVRGRNGTGMYAMTKSVRPKEAEAQHFARDVASMLGTGLDRRQYDAVALVAPARFLGILTDSLDAQTRKRVLIRVDKDLTHIKPRDLPEHFDDVFAAATREEHRRAGMT